VGPVVPYLTLGPGLLIFHNAWIAIIAYHLGMIAVVLLSRERIPVKILLQSSNYKIPAFTTIIGACSGVLLYLLWPLLSIPPDINMQLQNIGLAQQAWPYFLIYFILVNPWIEEYYWRSFLTSDSKFIIPNDLLFSGYHVMVLAGKVGFVWLIAVFTVLVLTAWAWRQFNRVSRGLLPSLVSHIAADITIIFTIYWLTMR
jgi:hypothetical protein